MILRKLLRRKWKVSLSKSPRKELKVLKEQKVQKVLKVLKVKTKMPKALAKLPSRLRSLSKRSTKSCSKRCVTSTTRLLPIISLKPMRRELPIGE